MGIFKSLLARGAEETSPGFNGISWANWFVFFGFAASVVFAVLSLDEVLKGRLFGRAHTHA